MSTTTKLHPRTFPRPPLCEPTPRHLQITHRNKILAQTNQAYWVLETHHPPTYYLPRSALSPEVKLTPTSHASYCEWKGVATYYSLSMGDEVVGNRVWSYENPTERFKGIRGYLSFYAGPWDCFVEGERVEAQPGDFYGGWMTADVEASEVKGAPGTRGW